MSAAFSLRGVVAAVVTPFDQAHRPDAQRAIAYYRELLNGGCDALNVMGTTGEGVSISVEDRLRFMEALSRSGLPCSRMIVGTGASALGDAILLTRAAFDLGFAAALVIPPFYYRDATDTGIARFYAALAEGAQAASGRLLLYNFPRMSGITFHADLVDLLIAQLGDVIGGVKDSSNDLALEARLRERFSSLAIFPGSEEHLLHARESGLSGCISGSVCLWPQLAQKVWLNGDPLAARDLASSRDMLKGGPLIAAVRTRLARDKHDESWLRSAPPLT